MTTGLWMLNLRYYQQEAIKAIYDWFNAGKGNPLVVIPTGCGKSLILADFVKRAISEYPDTRILMLTHVKELIQQNANELRNQWKDAPIGIYSAGLKSRKSNQITFAGIQSIYKKAAMLRFQDIIIIDECHLISRNAQTMYGKLLNDLRAVNPYLKIIGLTATPYRLDSGYLHKGKDTLFDGIAYEYSVADAIEDGFLCEPVPKRMLTTFDVSSVKKRGGEFIAGDLEKAIDKDDITRAAVQEIIQYGQDRKSWLVFSSGVSHAEHINQIIREHGIDSEVVIGDTPSDERDDILNRFKTGKLRCVVNCKVLTTGFNAPRIDLIADLNPTESAGLYVQKIGRGLRLAEGKKNCLILDFSFNAARHGPLDKLSINEPKEKTEKGETPIKVCPECETICHASIKVCPQCEYEFPPPEISISKTADNSALLLKQIQSEWLNVTSVTYERHEKNDKASLKVTYYCGLSRYSKWICLEHEGYAKSRAMSWWYRWAQTDVPATVEEALQRTNDITPPTKICVRPNGKYFEITGEE